MLAYRLLLPLVLLSSFFSLLFQAAPAYAHVDLDWSSPAEFEVLKTMPENLEFRFKEQPVSVEVKFLPGGAPGVVLPAVLKGDTYSVSLKGVKPRQDGSVAILLTTLSKDGHKEPGVLSFYIGKKPTSQDFVSSSPGVSTTPSSDSIKHFTPVVLAILAVLGVVSLLYFKVHHRRKEIEAASSRKKASRSGDPRKRKTR